METLCDDNGSTGTSASKSDLDTSDKPEPEPEWSVIDNPYFDAYSNYESNVNLTNMDNNIESSNNFSGMVTTTSHSHSNLSLVPTNAQQDNLLESKHFGLYSNNTERQTMDMDSLSVYKTDEFSSSRDGTRPKDKSVAKLRQKSFDTDTDDDMFECGICTEDLNVPKSLPCLHNFCLDCLQKYFNAQKIHKGQRFLCPTCRASVNIPLGGATKFPTNFHIINLRKRRRGLDMGHTIKDAVRYLECRADEIVEELSERKRQVLIIIGQRREKVVSKIEDIVETFQETMEEQYTTESTKAVDVIQTIRTKLSELQKELVTTTKTDRVTPVATDTSSFAEAIKLNALTKLRRQAEIISNVNNELEELKSEADRELAHLLEYQVAFSPGLGTKDQLQKLFGRLVMLHEGQTLDDVSRDEPEEGFSPLHVQSWSQSWWVLLFAVLPAVLCTLVMKVIMVIFEKILD